jgi:hypothetical protein
VGAFRGIAESPGPQAEWARGVIACLRPRVSPESRSSYEDIAAGVDAVHCLADRSDRLSAVPLAEVALHLFGGGKGGS